MKLKCLSFFTPIFIIEPKKKYYLINEVAQKLGISAGTIRYYEEKGLLSVKKDPENGYRVFTDEDMYKLWSVAYHRGYNVSLGDIRALKHGGSLADIHNFVNEQRRENLALLSDIQKKLEQFDLYDCYLARAGRYTELPCIENCEALYFYPEHEVLSCSGDSYPGCTFGSVFKENEETAYSVVLESDRHLLSAESQNAALFSVKPFRAIHVTVCLDSFLNSSAALSAGLEQARDHGFEPCYPCYVLYLLSSGSFEQARRYYDVYMTIKNS